MPSELPDRAIVVRGGLLMDHERMCGAAIRARESLGFYALSVFAKAREPGQSVDDVVRELIRHARIGNSRIRTTTAGRLRSRGFVLVQTTRDPLHYSVVLDAPDLATIIRFGRAFEPPKENPT